MIACTKKYYACNGRGRNNVYHRLWNDEPDPYISVTIADFEDGTNGAMFMHVMGCGEYDYEWLHSLRNHFTLSTILILQS